MKTATKTIRAIHINPHTKSVAFLDVQPDFASLRPVLNCQTIERVSMGMGVHAWIDEDGTLVDDWSKQGWTRFAGHLILAGHILLTGMDQDGEPVDMPSEVPIMEVSNMLDFMDHKKVRLPGTSITSIGPDGKLVTEFLGPQWRTHRNH